MNVLKPVLEQVTGCQIPLRIMATTDLHMNLTEYDYFRDRPGDAAGLLEIAGLIETLRRESENCLLLDNGDFLQGTPMADHAAQHWQPRSNRAHPAILAMNHLGYDAAAPGNHDFNFGVDFLLDTVEQPNFPFVAANVFDAADRFGEPAPTLLDPHVVLERQFRDHGGQAHPVRIGVIGFVPPQVSIWEHHHLAGRATVRDIVETAHTEVARLKARGADIVIALCHSGIGSSQHHVGMENAAVPLAAIEGIDALVLGHSHRVFPSPHFFGRTCVDALRGTIHGKPAVMGGAFGSHLGIIDLVLSRRGNQWAVSSGASAALSPAALPAGQRRASLPDALRRMLARDHKATLTNIRRKVGRTNEPLNTHFAQIAPNPALGLIAAAQKEHVRRALIGTTHAELPMLSAVSPIKAGGLHGPHHYTHIPAGDLEIRNISDLYSFSNRVAAVRLNGKDLRGWLERSAGMFHRITPGTNGQLLLDPRFPAYNFDVIHGLHYMIDLSQPCGFSHEGKRVAAPARRIVKMSWHGRPVTDNMEFLVATNDFRANGGGHFPGTGRGTMVFQTPVTIRDALVEYIRDSEPVTPVRLAQWRFRPLAATRVVFETSPEADKHTARQTGMSLRHVGLGAAGFARYELTL